MRLSCYHMITRDYPRKSIRISAVHFPYPSTLVEVSIFSCSPIGQSLGQMAWCVTSLFFFLFVPPPPHINCTLWITVGAGIRLSVLPVPPLTCLSNCFTGGCQLKKSPICERQTQPVNICAACLFCPRTDMDSG